MRTPTYEQAELEAVKANLEIALTKLRRLVDETEDPLARRRARGVVIKVDDALAALQVAL